MIYKLKVVEDTLFKQAPVQSNELPANEKVFVKAGSEFNLLAVAQVPPSYIRFSMGSSIAGRNTWLAYQQHVEVLNGDGTKLHGTYRPGDRLPASVDLCVPWFSQRKNEFAPMGTCNLTSVAMCLYFYGKRHRGSLSLDDELYQRCEKTGWDRHSHDDLVKVFESYGIKDSFKTDATWDEIKLHLANGNPVINSGLYTRSGHIIVFRGYDATGFLVNDPYGEWSADGYLDKSGENLHYSNSLVERVSIEGESQTWAHFPNK
jgi:hypothetical protein